MLALMAQVQASISGWLSLDTTERDGTTGELIIKPYTFMDKAGQTYSLPGTQAPGWSVFNAPKAELEDALPYKVVADTDFNNNGMLAFTKETLDNEQTFLALGISEKKDDAIQKPIQMLLPEEEANAHKVREDNLYATVRFVECADLPKIDVLKKMYPSYQASLPNDGFTPVYTAAKLGVCVGPGGYFYVTRVIVGEGQSDLPEAYTFEFCKSKVSYNDVGNGAVTIRIKFQTYHGDDGVMGRRAFCIYAKDAKNPDATEHCLTKGIGYEWAIADGEYQFDFASLGKSDEAMWLYAIDDSLAASDLTMPENPLMQLNRLAFSATGGGFYEAWMTTGAAQTTTALAAYDAKQFTPYVEAPGALFSLYTDWATKYNVNLTDYLEAPTGGISTYGAATEDLAEHAFDAFLLYMDPETNEPLRLTVTGLVTEADTVSFTVKGPAGCNLRDAVQRAAHLCIRRAADLNTLADAEPEMYDLAFSADGTSASFALPKTEGETELPFMQATLVPVTDIK